MNTINIDNNYYLKILDNELNKLTNIATDINNLKLHQIKKKKFFY